MDYILASVCQRNGAKTVTVERSLGSQPAREKREINTRHRQRGEERNQWHLFSLLIAFCFLLRTAGKVSLRAWTEISLSFPSPVSSFHLSLPLPPSLLSLCYQLSVWTPHFYFSPCWTSFLCRVMIAEKEEEWLCEAVITKMTAEAGSSRFINTADIM